MLRAVVWEPDLVTRRSAVSVLKLAGFDLVEQAASPQEALDLAVRVEPNVVVFAMPADGAAWSTALADLGEKAKETRLVALAGDEALRAKAAAAGAAAVLDPDRSDFLDRLTRVLQTEVPAVPDQDDQGEQWLPLREAAREAGVPLARLRHWCDRGNVPYRKEGGRRLVLVDDVRARATAEAPPDTAASAAPDGEAEADRTEPAPVVEPVVEPEAAEEPDPVAEPEAVAEPQPEETPSEATEADSFTLSWPPAGPPAAAPPRRSYDLIPDDGGRRGRRH